MARHSPQKWLRKGLLVSICSLLAGCAGLDFGGDAQPKGDRIAGSGDATDEVARTAEVERLLEMAWRARQGGDDMTAASIYARAVNMAPHNSEAVLGLGRALMRLDRPREAADVLGHALERQDHRELKMGYAEAMIMLVQPQAAIEQLEPLLVTHARDVDLLNLAGVAWDMAARHDQAQTFYRRGLVIEPDSKVLKSNLALSLALEGDYAEAVAVLEPLADGPGSTAQLRQNLALVYGMSGKLLLAERYSGMDLPRDAVENNLAYFVQLAAIAPQVGRSALLKPRMRDPYTTRETLPDRPRPRIEAPVAEAAPMANESRPLRTAERGPSRGKQAAVARPEGPLPLIPSRLQPAPIDPPKPKPTVVAALEGGPDELERLEAPAREVDGQRSKTAALERLKVEPVEDQLRTPPVEAVVAAAKTAPWSFSLIGTAPQFGRWVLFLGTFGDDHEARQVWHDLKIRHPEASAVLNRLAGVEKESTGLLVGPVAESAEAEQLCLLLRTTHEVCRPVML